MALTLRESPLFQFRHGDHICLFYRSQDSLMEVLTPYVADGLLKGDRCFCAQKPEILKRLVYDLRFLGMEPEREIKRGALELHTEDEAYFPDKRFEPSAMMEMLTRSVQAALDNGFRSLRTAGELSWAVQGRNECDQIIAYEKMVEHCFPGKAAIGMCQYAVNEFEPQVLESVLKCHRLHLAESKRNSLHSSMQVRYGAHLAEIVAAKYVIDPRYYYVVHRAPKDEIIGWGVAPSFDSATAKAEQLVRDAFGRTSAPLATA